jgi:transposase-like protein
MKQELLKGLSEEQIAKVKTCKNSDELLMLAKAEGVELTDEQIEAVSGGGCFSSMKCPNCGSKDFRKLPDYQISGCSTYKCNTCGHEWSL